MEKGSKICEQEEHRGLGGLLVGRIVCPCARLPSLRTVLLLADWQLGVAGGTKHGGPEVVVVYMDGGLSDETTHPSLGPEVPRL